MNKQRRSMMSVRYVALGLAVVVAALPFAPAQAVLIPTEQLPAARLVQESTAALTAQGCTELPYNYAEDSTQLNVPAGQPYRLVPQDSTRTTILYCSAAVAATVTVLPGQVAQAFSIAMKSIFCGMLGLATGGGGGAVCTGAVLADEAAAALAGTDPVIDSIAAAAAQGIWDSTVVPAILTVIELVATIVAKVGVWAMGLGIELLLYTISVSGFVTNAVVRAGWPFILGIANLGFMIALLFIALSAALQLKVGNPYRMLPRLFGAAVLVNFSLIIAGGLTDIAQLLMAIFVRYLSPGSINELGESFRESSKLLQSITDLRTIGVEPKFDGAASAITRAILTWIFTFAIFTLAIGFLIRYIALILLLVLSPLAYLAVAFPGADGLAMRWWKSFLQYVAYGPAALFILLLALRVNEETLPTLPGSGGFQNIINVIILATMLVAAASLSKSLGGRFATAAVNVSTKQARRAGQWAYRNPAKAAGIAATVATGGAAAPLVGAGALAGVAGVRAGARRVGQNLQDFRRTAGTELTQRARGGAIFGRVGQFLAGPERDAQGRLRRGQQSVGSRAAGGLAGAMLPETPRGRADRAAADTVRALDAATVRARGPHNAADPALSARNLRIPEVGRALSGGQITAIIARDDNEQISSVVNNIEIVTRMTPAHLDNLHDNLEGMLRNPRATDAQRQDSSRMLRDLQRTIDRGRRETQQATGNP